MNEREYDDLMRKALRDKRMWEQMTATASDAQQALEWLRSARSQTQTQIARRKLDWAERATALQSNAGQYRTALAEYREWRGRAIGFLGVVTSHLDALRSDQRQNQLDRASQENNTLRESVLVLAKAIARHEASIGTNGDLYALLDNITLSHGLVGELTLRSVLARLQASA